MMKELLSKHPVIPVLVCESIEEALGLTKALKDGGVRTVEVTLRTSCALDAIKEISSQFPDVDVGAGTVLNGDQLRQVQKAGAEYAVSPGSTPGLLKTAKDIEMPLLPGVATPSELVQGLEMGYRCFKFYPAAQAGGVPYLKSLMSPFDMVSFCPTGGVNHQNFLEYLSLASVVSVGGTWLTPKEVVKAKDWACITQKAKETLALIQKSAS